MATERNVCFLFSSIRCDVAMFLVVKLYMISTNLFYREYRFGTMVVKRRNKYKVMYTSINSSIILLIMEDSVNILLIYIKS